MGVEAKAHVPRPYPFAGRPKYTAKTREQAEDFFINSLAAWRVKVRVMFLGYTQHAVMGGAMHV